MPGRSIGTFILAGAAIAALAAVLATGGAMPADPRLPSPAGSADAPSCCACDGCPPRAPAGPGVPQESSPCPSERPCARCPAAAWTACLTAAAAVPFAPPQGEMIGAFAQRPGELVFCPPSPPPRTGFSAG